MADDFQALPIKLIEEGNVPDLLRIAQRTMTTQRFKEVLIDEMKGRENVKRHLPSIRGGALWRCHSVHFGIRGRREVVGMCL